MICDAIELTRLRIRSIPVAYGVIVLIPGTFS